MNVELTKWLETGHVYILYFFCDACVQKKAEWGYSKTKNGAVNFFLSHEHTSLIEWDL